MVKKSISVCIAVASLFIFSMAFAEPVKIAGDWTSNFGPMKFEQESTAVTAAYGGTDPGKLIGTLDGTQLTFSWKSNNAGSAGKGILNFSADGKSFDGKWGYKDSRSDGGAWTGKKK